MNDKEIQDISKKLQDALLALPQERFAELISKIKNESIARGLTVYDDNKKIVAVEMKLKPWIVTAAQERYTNRLSKMLRSSLNRIISNYFEDPLIKDTLPLAQAEEEWFRLIYPKGIPKSQSIFERFDTNADFSVSDWKNFKFIEFNSVGIGCVHFAPAANSIAKDLLLPLLGECIEAKQLKEAPDYRDMLIESMLMHASAISRPRANIAFVERREYVPGGADEFTRLSEYCNSRGMRTFIADPRDLVLKSGEIYYKDAPVDMLYRDYQIQELISIEKHGGNVDVIKAAFKRNQVVSSLAGEFDHKSICEFFTNPGLERYFTFWERVCFKRHFLWTRLIYDRKTHAPDGKIVDLAQYIRDNQNGLVIKPNRGYGGEGVAIGHNMATSLWNDTIQDAFQKPHTFVVQELAHIREEEFPVMKEDGKVGLEKNFTVAGFTSSDRLVTFLGRASNNKVVNITLGGGIIPVFLVT